MCPRPNDAMPESTPRHMPIDTHKGIDSRGDTPFRGHPKDAFSRHFLWRLSAHGWRCVAPVPTLRAIPVRWLELPDSLFMPFRFIAHNIRAARTITNPLLSILIVGFRLEAIVQGLQILQGTVGHSDIRWCHLPSN